MLHVYQITACPILLFSILQNNIQIYKIFKTQDGAIFQKLFLQREKAAFVSKILVIERKNPNENPTNENHKKILE